MGNEKVNSLLDQMASLLDLFPEEKGIAKCSVILQMFQLIQQVKTEVNKVAEVNEDAV